MQTPELGHAAPLVGSHCEPRFVLEPQTSYVPLDVVTALHWLNWSALWQAVEASAPASPLHAM
jgi:hypothetical protein